MTARDYSAAGLPWFDYYDAEAKALEGAKPLKNMKSVAELAKAKGDSGVGNAGGVHEVKTVILGPKKSADAVREGEF